MGGEPDGAGATAGGEASVGGAAEGPKTVHVRCSNGNKFSLEVDLSITVRALKVMLAERSEIPADQQRLIYKGRVLKDDNSLDSYGLQHDHTVHLVRGAPASATTPASSATTPTSTPAPGGGGGLPQTPPGLSQTAPGSNPTGLGAFSFPNFGAGAGGGGGGFGMGLQEIQQVQQQLMQNPNLMREMMNMPAVQNLMNNPDLMRSIIMSNPQMRDIIDRNPDLAHILNDPGTLRQTLDAARNPELMREMMRNTDRAMSNIEASPEGFNMLRRMYETVQEPLLNAATMGTEGGGDLAGNPFAALLGGQNLAQTPGQQIPSINLSNSTNSATGTPNAGAAAAAPNTAPLPNPWNPTPTPGVTGAGAGAAPGPNQPGATPLTGAGLTGLRGSAGLGGLAGLGLPEFGAGGGPFGVDPAMMQQMLQNPAIVQMMQGLLQNPQYINQVMNMQPHLRSLLNGNPQFREMMQSPDFIRQISSPESLQQMLQVQQAVLSQLQGRQQAGGTPGQPGATPGANAGLPDLSSLLSMFGGLGSTLPTNNTEVNAIPPEQLYEAQLSQLQDMGFYDTQENIRALAATGGNVHAAVERLLRNPG
ncbi:ubiquilin [Marchantia polymorpha subsp. ruderalis]|uniref:Uncharacterized protein n=2 Tax=Marchantia polymorpha TaxID=3197 RepID=A0AAF6ATB3_MARPO|nr:hypothetical protein MARPO_0065s0073 [Marchantia polymorpha]PTQ36274.1 hypothetical protein MARPO_0065s0073 [Marchantia polymorpha]BBM99682.1 hypothetical protein Mp_1g23030 [Marchantia polymorpha subsp. ruderalis]BBM99683.1 hypothetical protein Mp_1g23030 [Marchantia polymorpha subsp. ruderalis]|eukprot:PTQ36271.1 hypothetical protein MARPO_0065s0073 [Marchantia polymorpha]